MIKTNFIEDFKRTDPEFTALFDRFSLEDVQKQVQLDEKSRFLSILAALLGCQAQDEFSILLSAALANGVTPVEIKETLYQAAAYLGIGKVLPFLQLANVVLMEKGVQLPLEPQGTTTQEDRREKGTEAQVAIFGERMRDFWQQSHVNFWLAGNCFGDYYTRTGLDLRQREMITFCFLAAQGGCEPQLTSHASGNMTVGNDQAYLMNVVSNILPYIGYPRSLNAIACIRKAAEDRK